MSPLPGPIVALAKSKYGVGKEIASKELASAYRAEYKSELTMIEALKPHFTIKGKLKQQTYTLKKD